MSENPTRSLRDSLQDPERRDAIHRRSRNSDVSTRLQRLRDLLTSERLGTSEERRTAMDAIERESAAYVIPDFSRLERRRLEVEAQLREVDAALPPDITSESVPPPIQRTRRRVLRPTERLLRHGERLLGQNEDNTSPTSPSERPPPPIEPSEVAIQEYMDEAEVNRENRWRAKRRKLDDGTFEDVAQSFSYGHKGSVVEGPLRLEIVSCDGGEYSEPNGGMSRPQHALVDDASVYCTKSNHCNMLLKHVGGMPFSLTKITIKAPDDGYDAPIQEGMIFVSLDDSNLLEKTSQYEVRYSPRSYRHHYRRLDPRGARYWRPSHEYLHSHRAPLVSMDHGYLRQSDLEGLQNTQRRAQDEDDGYEEAFETALIPGFAVTTTYDTDDEHRYNPRYAERPHWHSYVDPDIDPRRLARAHRDLGDHYRPTYSPPPPPPPPFGYNVNRDLDPDAAEEDPDSDDASSASGEGQAGVYLPPPRTEDLPPRYASFREREWRGEVEAESRRAYSSTLSWTARNRDRYLPAPEPSSQSRSQPWTSPDVARRMSLRRETPSRIELRRPANDADPDGEGERRLDHGRPDLSPPSDPEGESTPLNAKTSSTKKEGAAPEILAPHARFFIRRDKSCVNLEFDPPVAGKYILIKLWASCPNANIDIQSIVAHGYGGPRFFPCVEVR